MQDFWTTNSITWVWNKYITHWYSHHPVIHQTVRGYRGILFGSFNQVNIRISPTKYSIQIFRVTNLSEFFHKNSAPGKLADFQWEVLWLDPPRCWEPHEGFSTWMDGSWKWIVFQSKQLASVGMKIKILETNTTTKYSLASGKARALRTASKNHRCVHGLFF